MKKFIAASAVALALIAGAFAPKQASAATIEELQAMIASLTAQLAALSGGSSVSTGSGYMFNSDLTIGSTGADVSALQSFLVSKGFLSMPAGVAMGNFGQLTKSAVMAYQTSVGVSATGYVGPMTRAKLNASSVTTTTTTTTTTTGTTGSTGSVSLSGGEGELNSFDTIGGVESSVDEGAEDEKVLGVEFDAEDSDVMVERVDVDITVGSGGSSSLEDYIDSVSLWLDGKKIAEADADEGDEDDDVYSFRFTGLKSVINEDDTAELYVAVSAVNNIDTGDEDVDLTVEVPENGIRAVDAAGISETYVSSSDDLTETFSVETRTGGDLEVTEASESPDDSTVQVDADSDTSDVTLLVIDLEADEQDIEITDLPVGFFSNGAGVGELIKTVKLMNGSETLDSVSVSSTTAVFRQFLFEDIDLTVDDGDTVTLKIVADFNDIDGAFTSGDSISATTTGSNAAWDVEDEEGEAVTPSGSVQSATTTLRSTGVMVEVAGTPSVTDKLNLDSATSDDEGVYTIEFEVSAFEDTAFVELGSATRGTAESNTGVNYTIQDGDNSYAATTTGSVSATLEHVSGGNIEGNFVRINTGDKAKLRLVVNFNPAHAASTGVFYRTQLYSVNFAGTAIDADTQELATPTEDFRTPSKSILN